MLPQIADGTTTGSGWRSTFIFANQSPTASTAVVSFYTDAGSPMSISIGGQVQTQITVTVPAQGVAQFKTDGLGAVQTGWAKVQADQVISGIALFSFYDGSGNFIDEAGDSAASPFQSLSVFVQSDSNTSTGIALANPYTNSSTVTAFDQ